ncbi:PREDICTED: T-cell-interacting, activating receptor on myeloid cells protein 1-like [Elephantulus edwardii]|uniref:T-cell-interacting, activating receptor on myeloid cells protein 1-like n=1 Tax=Elephantulus edwardii TaxID=28737 RepID=UPI0003F0657B|nr:PREDICTED: T-cell-interacting, activating receptor on myeloid cells protein 1-like [Elephantulus edwardii]
MECLGFVLLKPGSPEPLQVRKGKEKQMEFWLWTSITHHANYSCLYYQQDFPYLGSFPSNNVEIRVTDKDNAVVVYVTISTCVSLSLLFICIFVVYKCTQHGPHQPSQGTLVCKKPLLIPSPNDPNSTTE